MWSGMSSPGRATSPSGNSGKSRGGPSGMRPSSRRGAPRRQQQVVEDGRRQPGLEQLLVDALEKQVAAERILAPEHRHVGRIGARLERAVEPSEPVGEKLLAADMHVGESRRTGEAGEIVGGGGGGGERPVGR